MENNDKSKKVVKVILIGLLFLLLVAILFVSIRGLVRATQINQSPTVTIIHPGENGASISGTKTKVQATALSRSNPIVTLDFFINGRLAASKQDFNQVVIGGWDWTPSASGEYELAVVAYDETGLMGYASRSVVILPMADRDLDGTADDEDNCPDSPGPRASDGCPVEDDQDGDGIPDDNDICPDTFGEDVYEGCPFAFAPDVDSDGTPDVLDRCPEEPGLGIWAGCPEEAWLTDRDGDGIPDFMDGCPDWYGSPVGDGCPLTSPLDSDGDGVADADDLCAEEPGPPELRGCPLEDDRDGDGIPDVDDTCPDEPGWEGAGGCMDDRAFEDTDMDGVIDIEDRCPDEMGVLEYFGCPDPLDSDGDGLIDTEDNCPDEIGFEIFFGCPLRYFPALALDLQNAFIPELSPSYSIASEVKEQDTSDLFTFEDFMGRGGPEGEIFMNDRDRDGYADNTDRCPDEWGPIWNDGCLPEGDGDGDRIPDDQDVCPETAGYPGSRDGCPPTSDHELTLEVEILLVRTEPGMIGGYCFVPYPDYPKMVRIPPKPDFYHNIYELLPAHLTEFSLDIYKPNVKFKRPANGELNIFISCYGQRDDVAQPASHLGDILRKTNASSWDSLGRYAAASGRDGYIEIWYKICVNSCTD